MNSDIIGKAAAKLPRDRRATRPPGGGDDSGFNWVALDAIKCRRLVRFVENADRDQKQSGFGTMIVIQIKFDIGLLNFNFTFFAFTGEGVFNLQFGEKARARIEFVAEEQHETMEVDFFLVGCAAFALQIVVMQLAVAAQAGLVGPRCFAGGRAAGNFFHLLARRVDFLFGRFELAFKFLVFGFQRVQAGFHRLQAFFDAHIGVGGGAHGGHHCGSKNGTDKRVLHDDSL